MFWLWSESLICGLFCSCWCGTWVVIVIIVIILLVLMDLSVDDSIQIAGKVLLALGTTGVGYPVVTQAACLVKGSNQETSSVLLSSS